MSISEANKYLPEKNRGDFDAFSLVKLWHLSLGSSVPEMLRLHSEDKISRAVLDYFSAGVAFLANRVSDPVLQEVGSTAWQTTGQQRASVNMSTNMAADAYSLGIPARYAAKLIGQDDEPHAIMFAKKTKQSIEEVGVLLIPPHLILKANTNPVDALGTVAYLSSQLRDLANGRITIDLKKFDQRAYALMAHWLRYALQMKPKTKISSFGKQVLSSYPKGVESLPKDFWYKPHPQPPVNPHAN